MADASASTSSGGTSRAASPATSGRLPALDATTGVPAANASSTGSPKPSSSEGNTNRVAS